MLRRRIVYYAAIVCCLIGFVITNDKYTLMLLAILFGGGLFSFVLLMLGKIENIDISFSSIKTNSLSRTALLKIKATQKNIFPLQSIKVVFSYENALYQNTDQKVFFLRPGSKRECEYHWQWEEVECGDYTLKIDSIDLYDLFGAFSTRINSEQLKKIVVYPYIPMLNISEKEDFTVGLDGEKYNPFHSGNDISEVFDLKEYNEGDSIGSIHWKLSSKLDKLIRREFGSPSNDKSELFCDMAFPGYQDNHRIVDGVIGVTAAISQGMVNLSIIHHISVCEKNDIYEFPISNQTETIDSITSILSMHLSNAENATGALRIHENSERLVIITGNLQEKLYQELADKSNLTVVLITDNDKEYIEEREDFKIIAIPIEKLDKNIHGLEI